MVLMRALQSNFCTRLLQQYNFLWIERVQHFRNYRKSNIGMVFLPGNLPRGRRKVTPGLASESPEKPVSALDKCDDDAPIEFNPYMPEKPQCLLCKYKIKLDYKNHRLLSQFISSFSGRIYEKHVTGLCERQHQNLREAIRESRKAGYMPVVIKDPRFLRDPKLFDPMNPQRPNPF